MPSLARSRAIWPHVTIWMISLAAPVLLFPSASWGANSESGRLVTLLVTGGARIFNSQVDLGTDASLGLRLGLGVSRRAAIDFDYVVSGTTREVTGSGATVHAMRALVRYDFLTGGTRPYLVAGVGGLLFDFTDSQDYATGALTLGYGVSRRLGSRAILTLEGTGDLYRNRAAKFSSTGEELSAGPRNTQGLGTVSLGVGMEF